MNYGLGALSPINYANSIIGRAWTLMSINLGDVRPGATFTASTGTTINYNNMCCAENEPESAWAPFHVRKGYQAEESTVSLFRGWTVVGFNTGPLEHMLDMMKKLAGPMGASFTFVIDPLVAKNLKEQNGYDDPGKLSEWLVNELNPRFKRPEMVNFVVVGGEMNPMWMLTDFAYFQTVKVDPWIPKAGIKKDARPLRMPLSVMCADGSCGITH
jgi:hypothetical protein